MKKHFLVGIAFLALGISGMAQCDKKITWNAAKAEFLDSTGKVQDTKEEKIVVKTSSTEINLKHGDDENDNLTGDVKDLKCDWTEPYKNGKSVFKSSLKDPRGETKDAMVTIEGKDGKILITLEVEGMQGRKIKILVDDYKENS